MKHLKVLHLFSKEIRKLWNGWEIRGLIILSLVLQIILILCGSKRKTQTGILIKIIVWSTYMSADWVATVALGNLAKVQTEEFENTSSSKKYILQAFWAPFLLLHLGGPDTITAYSLEDNELWLRHFLGLIIQIGVAAYVLVRSWTNIAVSFMAIPVLIIGSIKYGERTYVLWSASTKKFKEDLLSTNPFEDNATGLQRELKQESFFEKKILREDTGEEYQTKQQSKHQLAEAHFLFRRLKYLFANLILGHKELRDCYDIIYQKSAQDAFKLVAIELGLMYDVLYTKATLIYSKLGVFLRCFIFVSSVTGLLFFSTYIDVHEYHDPTDIFVSFLLLGGAVFIEIYAFYKLLRSDWTMFWLLNQPRLQKISSILIRDKKRWSGVMAQYNLIDFCLKDIKGMRCGINKFPHVGKYIEEWRNLTLEKVRIHLQEAIYKQLQERGKTIKDNYTIKSCKELLARRGDFTKLSWSTIDIEFDHSLLVWHIATDLLYNIDFDQIPKNEILFQKCRNSKWLSDYMLYLLVICPSMLPQGIGEIRYRDTCAQVKQFLKKSYQNQRMPQKKVICEQLIERIGRRPVDQSVLSDGCKLAKELQSEEFSKNVEDRWTMITEVWIEMLAYVANHCGWKEHAQQLWKGGELLTHVCLLMAHLGLSEQYIAKE